MYGDEGYEVLDDPNYVEMREEFHSMIANTRAGNANNLASLSVEKYARLIKEIKDIKAGAVGKVPRHYTLVKRYDVVVESGHERLVYPGRRGIYYVCDAELFEILYATHVRLGHRGRDKMAIELQKKYKNITRHDIQIAIDVCHYCRQRRAERGVKVKSDHQNPDENLSPYYYYDVPQQVQQQSQSGGGQQGGGGGGGGQAQQQANPSSPSPVVPIAPKKVAGSSGVAQQQTPVAAQQPPPEVCLRWNSYYSNMQATFPSLLNNEQFVDVTLACEGRSIKCHKVMLSACSSYFEELLSQNPCQHPIVFMRDLKFWEVQALVEFMYSGEVNVAQDRLPSLLAAAEALQIKGLTGPSNSSSSHDEDSLPVPEIEESPSQYLQKRPRKRKMPSTPAYHQPKSQLIGPMTPSVKQQQVKVPMNVGSHSQVVGAYASPALAAAVAAATQSAPAAHSQSRVPSPREHHPHHPIHLSKIKRETSSPITVVKQEPIDMSTDYSQGDSDTGQSTEHEMSAVDCTTTITVEPGPIGLTVKGHHNQQHQSQQQQQQQHQQQQQNDNGLSEDDDHTESSNCSEDQQRFASQQHQPHQTDTGESGGGGASSSV